MRTIQMRNRKAWILDGSMISSYSTQVPGVDKLYFASLTLKYKQVVQIGNPQKLKF